MDISEGIMRAGKGQFYMRRFDGLRGLTMSQMFVKLVWQYETWDGRAIGVYEDGSEMDITNIA